MAIAKRPNRNPESDKAERFIAGQAAVKKGKRVPVIVRFEPSLLARVDDAARRRGISRSGWLQFVVSRAIDGGEG